MALPDYTNNTTAGLQSRLTALQTPATSSPITGGAAVLEDPNEVANAEKTARWGMQDMASQAHYSGTKPLGLDDALKTYTNILGNNPDMIKDLKQRLQFGYADGGKIDPEALLAQMRDKYKVGNTSAPAPQPAPAPSPAPVQAQPAGLVQSAVGAIRGRAAQIDKAAGYNKGGKIKGPGTATSDSIPAKVKQTGENILVSNGERIISAKQDQLLHRIAMERGFESVDQMLEHGTGEPVGPTIVAGKRGAATGWRVGYEDQSGYHPATVTPGNRSASGPIVQNQQLPDPPAQQPDIDVAAANQNFNSVFKDADFQKPKAWYAGADSRDERTGLDMERERRSAVPAEILANDPVKSALAYGVVGAPPVGRPAPVAAAQSVTPLPDQTLQVAPPAAGRTTPEAPVSPILAPNAATLTTKDVVPGGFTDRGAGIVGSRSAKGQLNVTNVGTEGVADRSSPIVDGSASALIDQKNSTYNPAAQLERMQRMRVMGEATDSSITDPSVRQQAVAAIGAINQGAKANLENAQAGQATALTAQTQQMEQMRGKLLDPNTPAEERARLIQALNAINGKADNEIKIAEAQTFDPTNPMVPIKVPYGVGRNGEVFKVEDRYKALQQKQASATQQRFEVGKTYTDGKGNKAVYQADGTWKEIK